MRKAQEELLKKKKEEEERIKKEKAEAQKLKQEQERLQNSGLLPPGVMIGKQVNQSY